MNYKSTRKKKKKKDTGRKELTFESNAVWLLNQEDFRGVFVIAYGHDFGDALAGYSIETKHPPFVSKNLNLPMTSSPKPQLALPLLQRPLCRCPLFWSLFRFTSASSGQNRFQMSSSTDTRNLNPLGFMEIKGPIQ